MENILNEIKKRYKVKRHYQQRSDLLFISVDKNELPGLLLFLRDQINYTHFVDLTAVDWLEENEFQLTYILNNPSQKNDIGIRVRIDREEAVMDSVHQMWEQVATCQRELKEMYGIEFPASPGLNEAFLLEGWDGIPPMRREFDTKKYSEETFFPRPGRSTNDPAEYMKQQLYSDYPTRSSDTTKEAEQ